MTYGRNNQLKSIKKLIEMGMVIANKVEKGDALIDNGFLNAQHFNFNKLFYI